MKEDTSQSQRKQPHVAYSMIGVYPLPIAKALNSYGVDATKVLSAVGVTLPFNNDPLRRMPTEMVAKLFSACVAATGDPCFGLTVSRFIHISNLHAVGYAIASSGSLMDFWKRLIRYYRILAQHTNVRLVENGDRVSVHYDFIDETVPEAEDAFVGFLILTMRQLYRPDFSPTRVDLCRASPDAGAPPYEALFGAPVTFGAAAPMLEFSREDLLQPLIGSCPDLALLHDQIANDTLAQLEKSDIVAAVKKKIVELLPNGECTRERVARELAMSSTTLQSRLAEQGTSFLIIFDGIRKDLACNYVRQGTVNLAEIAFMLGFSDTSNFARAFRRWTECSPTEFRRSEVSTPAVRVFI